MIQSIVNSYHNYVQYVHSRNYHLVDQLSTDTKCILIGHVMMPCESQHKLIDTLQLLRCEIIVCFAVDVINLLL